jgi:hypothetical protein
VSKLRQTVVFKRYALNSVRLTLIPEWEIPHRVLKRIKNEI